jgi:hypothetical protein
MITGAILTNIKIGFTRAPSRDQRRIWSTFNRDIKQSTSETTKMFRTLRDMMLGAIITAFVAASVTYGSVGIAPLANGTFATIDQTWLNGLAGGVNFTYQYGISAVGTNQATATQLPAGVFTLEVDTSGSGGATGVALPACFQGTQLSINNNTAYTFDVYPAIVNNPITAAQDTINNTTSTTITTYARKTFSCAKNGVWAAG